MTKENAELVIITGMSGAGKSIAMRNLEDSGFYCIDNLPPQLIPTFSNLIEKSDNSLKHVAIAVDLRSLDFFEKFPKALQELTDVHHIDYTLVFLDATDKTLIQRYKQSRRQHPLSNKDSLLQGIEKERALLSSFLDKSDIVIDTSNLKPLELKDKLMEKLEKKTDDFSVKIMSFGFKYGIALDADLVFDVRFLPNPHYIDALRPKTGKDSAVSDYVFSFKETNAYVEKLIEFIDFSLPQYKAEGKQELVIAIGCTGGKHRSVALTEKLGEVFSRTYKTHTSHRDTGRE